MSSSGRMDVRKGSSVKRRKKKPFQCIFTGCFKPMNCSFNLITNFCLHAQECLPVSQHLIMTHGEISRCPLRNSGNVRRWKRLFANTAWGWTAISSQPQMFLLVELKLNVLCINSWCDRIWVCEQSHLCIREMRHLTARIHNWNTKFRWTMVCPVCFDHSIDQVKHVTGCTRIVFHSVLLCLINFTCILLSQFIWEKIGHTLRPSFYAHTRCKTWLVLIIPSTHH